MPDPLNYKKSGIPNRTARTIARAHGAKVPPLPATNGYCAADGHPHEGGTCAKVHDTAAVAEEGGHAKLPVNIKPFKLGGG